MQKNNTPRRKRLTRNNRLQSAKNWIPKYTGKNIVKGYSNRYGVDLICSIKELRMLGTAIDKVYEKQVIESINSKTKAKRLNSKNEDVNLGHDFVFIAGYTSGGAPYGILNEELICDENGDNSSDVALKPDDKTK